MRWLLLPALATTVLAAAAFIAVFGDPRRKADPLMAWHLWSFAALTAVADAALLLLGLGVQVPGAAFVVIYTGDAAVAVWRLVLAIQGRRRQRLREG